jgi:hypothetical protein
MAASGTPDPASAPLDRWMCALEARHLADLRFAEVARALRALSSTYVERRSKLPTGAALAGAGKRAAFALFYGPLHFLIVSRILETLRPPDVERVVDLGCGTGAAGSAWALAYESDRRPVLLGFDRHAWAVDETIWTYRTLGLRGRAKRRDLSHAPLPGHGSGVVAAYTVNEIDDPVRRQLLDRLLDAAARGARVLVVEPISGRVTPWWPQWRSAVERAGGGADEWRFEADLPELMNRLDRAGGLDHRELTAKSLWL